MFKSVLNIFFPKVCYACLGALGDYEDMICVDCRHNLPVTNFHFDNSKAIQKVLYGRCKIEHGTALFRFEKKSLVQQLIHGLKYKGYQNIGVLLGNWLGTELQQVNAYRDIDMIIPVPLHKKKLRSRGYNQVEKFGQHIAKALNVAYIDNVLVKISNTKSQTKKGRMARWVNSEELFDIQNLSSIENKHILLVDDIITTGATMEACILVLNRAKNIKISIATMAIA